MIGNETHKPQVLVYLPPVVLGLTPWYALIGEENTVEVEKLDGS